jgi:hypothetical protein
MKRTLQLGTTALILGLLGWGAWNWVSNLPWQGSTNYGSLPPPVAFATAMGYPPPKGVTNLRVAGHSYAMGMKHWVWITFDFTDSALKQIVNTDMRLDGPDEGKHLAQLGPSPNSTRFDAEDKRKVGWVDPNTIHPRELYIVGQPVPGSSFIWLGVMVVDRKHHRAYAKLYGD